MIYCDRPSKGAKALAGGLGVKRIKVKGSRLRGRRGKTVINWGASTLPEEVRRCTVWNTPEAVGNATDKTLAFKLMTGMGVSTVPYTDSRELAQIWVDAGDRVVCRTLTKASEGRGIVMADKVRPLVFAPLYTKYVKKQSEWRVHVMFGCVIDIQRKVRDKDNPLPDWEVRNHDRGFFFQRHGLDVPDGIRQAAVAATDALQLDFGAVDILYNRHAESAYVLEINTAPGLEGTTLENYVENFREEM